MAIDNYLDNITSQYRDKPNFIAWLSAFLNKIDGVYTLLAKYDDDFDIDNATGDRLDMLGQIIGRERELTFQPLNNFSPTLTDDYYRTILKTKIAMNNWDGLIPSMYTIWNNIFGDDDDMSLQIKDNQDMSFDAYITGYVDQIQQDLIQHGYIVPKPEGVKVNYIGRSKITFKPYQAMVVCEFKSETITATFDQTERIKLMPYQSIVINEIKTETINFATTTSDDVIYVVDENGNTLMDSDGSLVITT